MRGVILVISLLAAVWLFAFIWVLSRVWGVATYCVKDTCYQLTHWLDTLNFVAMNATTFTWAMTPIVVTIAVFPLLYYVIREVRRRKRKKS